MKVMKNIPSTVSTLFIGLTLTLTACGKDKKEPAKAEPAKTEPAKTEPAAGEPKTEPAKTEPAAGEPKADDKAKADDKGSGGGW